MVGLILGLEEAPLVGVIEGNFGITGEIKGGLDDLLLGLYDGENERVPLGEREVVGTSDVC